MWRKAKTAKEVFRGSYVCLLPQTIRPGMDLSVSITLHKANGPVTLQLSVTSNTTKSSVIAATEMRDVVVGQNPETRLMKLKIPMKLLESEYLVKISGSEEKGLIFTNSTMVKVVQRTNLLLVQTDKAKYKPGQTVLFRVVAIYPTMKPCKEKMDIVIYDPARNRIAQWLQKHDENGVVGGELALSKQTPLGNWTIEVKTAIDSCRKAFEVSEYVLPKFEVNIAAPKHFTLFINKPKQQPSLFVTVTARYTYNQAVKGTVTLSSQAVGSSWTQEEPIPIPLVKTAQLKDGVTQFEITPEDLSQMVPPEWKKSNLGSIPAWVNLNYSQLLFSAKVHETVTEIELSSDITVMCTSQKYVLEFLDITPDNYKRGLTYTGFVALKQRDGEIPPLTDIQLPNGQFREVTITLVPTRSTFDKDCSNKREIELKAKLTASGLITFNANIEDRCECCMEALFEDESTGVNVKTVKHIGPFFSETPTAIHVSLKKTDSVFKAGDVVPFEITSTAIIKDLFYCVSSKVGILLTESISNVQTKTHLLNIEMHSELAPLMRLVVWVVAHNPKDPKMFEVISDSIQVNVERAFENNVTLGFDSDKVQPGDNVTLKVKASGGSNVFVLAVDQSVLLLGGGNDITQDSVFDALSSYEDGTVAPMGIGPIFGRGRRFSRWARLPRGQDSMEIFQDAKLICLTDCLIYQRMEKFRKMLRSGGRFESRRGDEALRSVSRTEPEAAVTVRTFFPETWIWDSRTTGSDGVGTFEVTAPDSITSWVASAFAVSSIDGFGISPLTSTLTVFRPFFISLTLPYSIRRGEVFALKATVFNYLNESLTVKVTLKNSTFFNVQIGKESSEKEDVVETIEVKKNDATSVTFWINATRLGEIPIEVLAQGGAAGDGERRTVLVLPEGIEQHYSTSVLIDNSVEDKPFETEWNVVLPSSENEFVPDSASIQVTAIGDILMATLDGMGNLIRMPYGCGEQQMLNTAPNVYILLYLRATGSLKEEIEIKCKKYLLSGYQAELTFQRYDGSFSAYGNSDLSGSTWLSAYVVNVFNQARNDIPIEDSKLAKTLTWMIKNQNRNGSFAEPLIGGVISVDMQGGTSKGVPLTAFVLISLINNKNNSALNKSLIRDSITKAVHYLEHKLNSLNDSYSLCIVTHALVLAHSPKASLALKKRDALAIKTADQIHWEKLETTSSVKKKSKSFRPPFIQTLAINVEMTAYALLTSVVKNDVQNCMPIAKWLLAQRNPYGGFVSSQDTVMGLQALASFASLMYGKLSSFSLHITASSGKENHTFDSLTPKNMTTLQKWEPTEALGPVVIKANGLGIGLVQLNVKYYVYTLPSDPGLVLTVSPVVKNDGRTIVLKICAKWTKEEPIGMVLLVIQLLSGYNYDSIQEVGKPRGLFKKVEPDPQSVSAYFDTLDEIETCVEVTLIRDVIVNNLKNSTVKLFEYYKPDNFVTTTYGLNSLPA